jgi:hypothetical protein
VPLDELYVIPAVQLLKESGSHVATHAKARIVIADDRVSGVVAGGEQIPAAVVISAVPWFAMGEVFDSQPVVLQPTVERATALGSAPIVTVDLWFEKWHSADAMLGLPGRHFQWLFDRRRYVDSSQTHVSLISSGADAICAQSNDQLVAIALSELRGALPEARHGVLRHAAVIRERRATFSLKPGSPARPPTETPVRGLFLAGDWIATGLPATIESAVVSGRRAATAALRYLHPR